MYSMVLSHSRTECAAVGPPLGLDLVNQDVNASVFIGLPWLISLQVHALLTICAAVSIRESYNHIKGVRAMLYLFQSRAKHLTSPRLRECECVFCSSLEMYVN